MYMIVLRLLWIAGEFVNCAIAFLLLNYPKLPNFARHIIEL